ncbi:MAG: hypothetical protein ABI874_00615 [Chloroflexota bacterium]
MRRAQRIVGRRVPAKQMHLVATRNEVAQPLDGVRARWVGEIAQAHGN